jgi:hypothetical protein
MVDLYFYRDPEEERVAEELGGEIGEAEGEWGGAAAEPGNWEDQVGIVLIGVVVVVLFVDIVV